jgi:hypothetical protein
MILQLAREESFPNIGIARIFALWVPFQGRSRFDLSLSSRANLAIAGSKGPLEPSSAG